MINLKVFCDGGSRGNPGSAGIGVFITQKSKPKNQNWESSNSKIKDEIKISKYIGVKTNNQAEYMAVIEALKYIKENFSGEVITADFYLDSKLVIEQLNQRYKLKNEGLKPLFWEIRNLMIKLDGKISFIHIPREKNKEADVLVNKAIDDYLGDIHVQKS